MLYLDTFKIESTINSKGASIIKINKDKIPFDFSAGIDYVQQAKKFVESKGFNVLGYNHITKIMVASLEKYDLKQVYQFSELSDKVKLKVIEQLQPECYHDFLESTNDYLIEILNNFGFGNVKLEYSASYSQSDYFRFTGTFDQIDLSKVKIEYEKVDDILNIIELIETLPDNLRFDRANGDIEILDDYLLDTQENLNTIETVLNAIDKLIKTMVYNEIDYQSQDSTIIENIEANGYKFYENGEIV
jgi:hypothetical protein